MRRGALLMVVAAFFFSAMTAGAKLARNELTAVDLVAWRSLIAIPLAFFIARGTRLDLGNRRAFAFRSLQHDRAAMVAGASYSGPIWGVLIDFLVFGTIPSLRVFAGGALSMAAGLVFLRRG